MKEEYLEIEEYRGTKQPANNNEDEQTCNESDDVLCAQRTDNQQPTQLLLLENEQKRNDIFQTNPPDFDGDNDDQMLRKLLNKFQMSFLYPFFKASDVTYRSLRFLSVDDINATIRSIGHRAEFREKLFAWRRKRYRTNDVIIEFDRPPQSTTTTSATDVTQVKLENTTSNTQTTSNLSNFQNRFQSHKRSASSTDQFEITEMQEDGVELMESKRFKVDNLVELKENHIQTKLNLDKVLNQSLFGPVLKAYYQKYGTLERKHRDELVQLIVNYVTGNEIKLHSMDFSKIVDMILNIFPAEEEFRDYYYIHRNGKRNPMGRLYTKYYNTLKRIRVRDIHQELTPDNSSYLQTTNMQTSATATTSSLVSTSNQLYSRIINNSKEGIKTRSRSSLAVSEADGGDASNSASNTQIEFTEDEFQENIQLDDTSAGAIKNFLCCQGLNWSDVKTMWLKTYVLRQEEIEHSTIKDLLKQWPKYLNSRGVELFDIDFRMKFPRHKLNAIQRKWPHFSRKMSAYYQTNIRDDVCKGLYALYKTEPGKDTEDYIITVLLNAIMIPMARYRDALGNRRKISIVEAVDLFAIRVTSLEELAQKREEILIKYGEMHSDYTPLIVVLGDNNINIHEIYVHFDFTLYEMPDYLSALDACMKIYRVLNLPYPASNEYLWTFIQRYFYEIQLPEDVKYPSMSTIISHLKF